MGAPKSWLGELIPKCFRRYSNDEVKSRPELFFKTSNNYDCVEEAQIEVFMGFLAKQFGFKNAMIYHPALVHGEAGVYCDKWPSEIYDNVKLHTDLFDELAKVIQKDYDKLPADQQKQARSVLNDFPAISPFRDHCPVSIKQLCDTLPLLSRYITRSALYDNIKLPCFDYVFSQTDRHNANMAFHQNQSGIYDKYILFDNAFALSHLFAGELIHDIEENIKEMDNLTMCFGAVGYNRKIKDFPRELKLINSRIPTEFRKQIISDCKKVDIDEATYECKEITGMEVPDKLYAYAQILYEEHAPKLIDALSDSADKVNVIMDESSMSR